MSKSNISETSLPDYDYFQCDVEDKKRIKTLLRTIVWEDMFYGLSLPEKISKLYQVVEANVDIIFPRKKTTEKEISVKNPAKQRNEKFASNNRIPKPIRVLMRNKNKLSKALLKIKSAAKYAKYQSELENIENKLKSLYDSRRKKQEDQALKQIKSNPRAFYSYAKRFSKLNTGIGPLTDTDGDIIDNDFDQAEALRCQYETVFSKPNKEETVSDDFFNESEVELDVHTQISNIHFVRDDITEAIDHLSNYAAAGPDGFPAVLLKLCKDELAHPLHIIFRESLDTGVIPDIWKKAFVFPIHKGGDRSDPASYRPVSLTSHLMKTFERVIKKSMVATLEYKNRLNNAQHGFRQKRSCLSQLLQHYDKLLELMEEGDNVDVVYLDFAKAFDKVDHGILLRKLRQMGVIGKVGKWIQNFLKSRTQQVIVSGTKSGESQVLSGVPQGSVLGPLLFLIMINDITEGINSYTSLFADDTRVASKISSEDCVEKFQEDLDKLYTWQENNKMKFNGSKFEIMRYGSIEYLKENTVYFTPNMESPIEEKDTLRDLGIILTSDMKFKAHIDKVTATVNQKMGWILRTFRSREDYFMKVMWKQLLQPHIDYCSQLYFPGQSADLARIENLQRKFTKKNLKSKGAKLLGQIRGPPNEITRKKIGKV